jgi:hypothetical protein
MRENKFKSSVGRGEKRRKVEGVVDCRVASHTRAMG